MVEAQTDFKKLMDDTLAEFKVLEAEQITKQNKWVEVTKDKNLSLFVYLKDDAKPNFIRVEAELDATIEEILEIQTNLEKRKELMSRIKEMAEIRRIDQDSLQFYWRMSVPMPFMEDRDFCIVYRIYRENDGKVYFLQKSVEDASRPKVKGVTRGIMHQGGFALVQLENNKTKLVNISKMDIDFNPPNSMVAEMRSKQITGLQKAILDNRNAKKK